MEDELKKSMVSSEMAGSTFRSFKIGEVSGISKILDLCQNQDVLTKGEHNENHKRRFRKNGKRINCQTESSRICVTAGLKPLWAM